MTKRRIEFVADSYATADAVVRLMDHICKEDFFSHRKIQTTLGVGKAKANKYVDILRRLGILGEHRPGNSGSAVLVYCDEVELVPVVGAYAGSVEAGTVTGDTAEAYELHAREVNQLDNESETNQYEEPTKDGLPAINPETGKFMGIEEYCGYYGIPFEHVKSYKLVAHQKGYQCYNIASHTFSVGESDYFSDFKENLLQIVNESTITYEPKDYTPKDDDTLLLISLGDLHIGKLVSEIEAGKDGPYNNEVAIERTREGIEGLIRKAGGFDVGRIALVDNGDLLHVDGPGNSTTKGTPQDQDGFWWESFAAALKVVKEAILRLTDLAPVRYVSVAGNHDATLGHVLGLALRESFAQNPNVVFDVDVNIRKYMKHGSSIVCVTHGNGIKLADLALTISSENPHYSAAEHRICVLGHLHHQIQKEVPGLVFHVLKSISSADRWHKGAGFIAKPGLEALVISPSEGCISRLTHTFRYERED